MPRQKTKVAKLGALQKLRDSLTANQADLPQLQGSIAQLDTMLTTAYQLTARQSALTAAKQDVSKQVVDTLTEAQRLSTVLRLAVKQHFGIRSEKLVEFDLQPFRGLKKSDTESNPLPEKPAL